MKKLLLFVMAVGATLSVSAVSNVAATKEKATIADAQSQKLTKEIVMQSADANLTLSTSSESVRFDDYMPLSNYGVEKAEGEGGDEGDGFTPKPYYYLPAGTFFGRTIMDGKNGSYVRRPLYVPGDQNLAWRNATMWDGDLPSDFTFTWNYSDLVEGDEGYELEPKSVNAYDESGKLTNYTSNYPMYLNGIPTPAINMCGTSYGDQEVEISGGGMAPRYLIRASGYATGKLTSGTYPWSFGNFDFYEYNGWAANGATCESYYDFVFCSYGNYNLNSTNLFSNATPVGYATTLQIPAGKQFGVTEVTVNCWVKALPSTPLKLDFYEMGWADNPAKPGYGWYVPGARIGGGWLNPDELKTDIYSQTVVIPMREGEGDFVSKSFVNLTGNVLAIISCEGAAAKTISFPIVMMDADKSNWRNFGYCVLDIQRGAQDENAPLSGKQLYAFSSLNATNYQGIANAKLLGLDMNFVGSYTSIDLPSDANVINKEGVEYVEVVFTGSENEKTINVEPYWDMESTGKFTVEGDAEDWLYAYAEAWDENYVQPLVIQADPLPDGVTGRVGVIKAEIPGAVLNILVKQGDTSGIDTIEGDNADVVSSQIFDLQGRQLNAVPESGLYIRRDVKADNTISTVKVVK